MTARIASSTSPYGWKARIGLIVPSTNTVNEPEFWQLAPRGVSIHTSRVLATGPSDRNAFVRMEQGLELATEQLATAEVDVVAYGCTTGSIVCPLPELVEKMTAKAGVPSLTTAAAVVAALRACGVRRVAVGTPYNDYLNDSEARFLRDYGFEVAHLGALQPPEGESRRTIGRIPLEASWRLAHAVDRPDADAVFLSCTNLATLDVIAELEHELGKPVITSNQATFWACLRMLRLNLAIDGYGRLLQEQLAPIDAAAFAPAVAVR
ncbi:MAG: aspartate/glutamate racemase family protein [Lautropia sp.]